MRGVNTLLNNVLRSLHPQYQDKVPLSKALNPQLLPGRRSINGCPVIYAFCSVCVCVCVHCCVCALGWVNVEHEFQVWVTILGCMSLSLYSRYFGAFSCTDEYEAIIHSLQDFVILQLK